MSYEQSYIELQKQLSEQMRFLETTAKEYDQGNLTEIKRASGILRILLHDKGRTSLSLLGQLGIKDKIRFCDSSGCIDEKSMYALCNLIALSYEYFSGTSRIEPLCFTKETCVRDLSFVQWWNQTIFFEGKTKRKLSRGKIILTMAEQDGGVHVDPRIRSDYASIAKQQLLGWDATINGNKINVENAIYAMMRQICYEVILSIDSALKNQTLSIDK